MQMGDHQMMGNQRAFVQKVIPAPNGGGVPQNVTYVQNQGVRMVHPEINGQQRIMQPIARQVPQNGTGPHFARQNPAGQQFQPNYGGTIAGRSVAVRAVQVQGGSQVYQRTTGGIQVVAQGSQSQPRQMYMATNNGQQGVPVVQGQRIIQQGQQQHPSQQHFSRPQQTQNQMLMQQHHRQQNLVQQPSQQHQMNQQPQMVRQQIMPQHPAPIPQPHMQQRSQQQVYGQPGMNLAVPLREPSPEPVVIKTEPQPEVEVFKKEEEPMPDDSDIDIQIRNVVCNYTLPLHIDLRKLAMNTHNVTYEREKGVMMKQKRNPGCYIKVYSSGKVYIVGCRSEDDCRRAARSIARHVQRVMGKTKEKVSIRNYRVNNVLATCRLPFGIKIEEVAAKYPAESTYEPELSVGLVWRSTTPKATLRIHTTGSITVTGASSEADVLEVLSKIYPIVLDFRCHERAKGNVAAQKKRKRKAPTNKGTTIKRQRFDDANYGNSGVINNQVYFSDEDEDLYDDLDLED
ncbi:Protein CBR-TLF-1 [Caenorhabditis briggsae]|uniref:TATA box-binding protein-like 1 n=2 Tax=Caenorhabditis briggsae TaxID=6238 RepID=A0AAE9DVV4_CAEBR|nr:Protein CBR-TLF-1 [Caenorhabditis briggsae]ULU12431.1 hypothetical protein L3Y34_015606 [Caenorhabditis briggsae]CAP31337.1 Protein CBR-TLF-1 [Caenorhabditis briggsae]